MMRRSYLWALWPVALVACSSTTPPQQSVANSGASSGSASGSQGESGSATGSGSGSEGSGSSTGTAASGTSSSGNGSGSASGAGIEDAAPTSEASTAEEGGSGGNGTCAGLFCEDFEDGAGQLDTTKWNLEMGGGGMAMVQTQIVAHGKYAWQVHGTGAGGGFATILTKSIPMALQGAGPVYGRLYLYATANYGAHISLGSAGTNPVNPMATPTITPGINFNYQEFAEFSNSWQLGFDLFTPAPAVASGFIEEAAYPPAHDMYPTMKWDCVEWEFGDNPTMMLLWLDGTQIDQFDAAHIGFYSGPKPTAGNVLNGKNSGIIGGYSVFAFGFHSYGTSQVVDRYFDDIVLDTKRVGCLPDAGAL
jgi:hypothetical protein